MPKSAEEVPKSAEDVVPVNLEGQQLQIYNYVLVNKAITTAEAEKLLGVKERRARKILSDMCNAGILMKIGATSNLKYVLRKTVRLAKKGYVSTLVHNPFIILLTKLFRYLTIYTGTLIIVLLFVRG